MRGWDESKKKTIKRTTELTKPDGPMEGNETAEGPDVVALPVPSRVSGLFRQGIPSTSLGTPRTRALSWCWYKYICHLWEYWVYFVPHLLAVTNL